MIIRRMGIAGAIPINYTLTLGFILQPNLRKISSLIQPTYLATIAQEGKGHNYVVQITLVVHKCGLHIDGDIYTNYLI